MKNSIIISLIVMLLIPATISARISCGNDMISKGDSSFETMRKLQECGELFDKEVIQEETTGSFRADIQHKGNRSRSSGSFNSIAERIERWYLIIDERGGTICWTVIFKAGKLHKFEGWERCD